MAIDLDNTCVIPAELLGELKQHTATLETLSSIDQIIKTAPFRKIAERLEEFVQGQIVTGYHCTKEPETGYLINTGLRILNREAHQAEFRSRFNSEFSPDEWKTIESAWSEYFPGAQDRSRNGRLWFCMSAYMVANTCTHYFFDFFGGEAINMPLIDRFPTISEKLRRLGHGVVVKVRIRPASLKTFASLPFALDLLSHYHRQINPSALVHSLEGYLTHDIPPDEIIEVIPKNVFFERCGSNRRS